jgi:uncharacterized protein
LPGDVSGGAVEVEHVEAGRRFEAQVDGETVGYLAYETDGDGLLDLTHTVVAPAARGQGVGEALVREALAHARARGARVIPSCAFVQEYLEGHPGDRALVAGEG